MRYYGQWMRDEAEKRIGHLYPKVTLPAENGGGEATVIAWLWARTVTCPNPACRAQMPLVRSFWLSTKTGKQAWVEPVVDRTGYVPVVRFEVKTGRGKAPDPPKVGRGAKFKCIACGQVASKKSVRGEFQAKKNSAQLMAIVAEGHGGRIYLPPDPEHDVVRGPRPDRIALRYGPHDTTHIADMAKRTTKWLLNFTRPTTRMTLPRAATLRTVAKVQFARTTTHGTIS